MLDIIVVEDNKEIGKLLFDFLQKIKCGASTLEIKSVENDAQSNCMTPCLVCPTRINVESLFGVWIRAGIRVRTGEIGYDDHSYRRCRFYWK